MGWARLTQHGEFTPLEGSAVKAGGQAGYRGSPEDSLGAVASC